MTKKQKEQFNFTSLDTRSLTDKVESILIDYLQKLKPGDNIPKEVDLASQLGVSRTVIREALNRLKTMGLIESIKHRGAVIRSPDLFQLLKKSMIPGILAHGTLRDIFEIRLALEIGMADLVFLRKNPSDIEELYEIVSEEPEYTEDIQFDKEHEIKFHGKLYEISQNKTLMNFQNLLLPLFDYVYATKLITRTPNRIRHVTHKELVDTLNNKTAKAFRDSMRGHLENHFSRLATLLNEKDPEKNPRRKTIAL